MKWSEFEKKSKEAFDMFPHSEGVEYVSRCTKCKKEYTLLTQEDDNPEYYTMVRVKCICGGVAYFELPVN